MIDLYEIALSYVGTPHHNGGNVKGAGLDCSTLMTNIHEEATGIHTPVVFDYQSDWYCKRDHEELLLKYLEEYCYPIEESELRAGDMISYRWGRSDYAHVSMYLGKNKIIHCSADNGTELLYRDTELLQDRKGQQRETGYWRWK